MACRDSVVPYEGMGAVSMSDLVLYDARAPVAHITLNRPDKLNALSGRVLDELEAALRRAVADDAGDSADWGRQGLLGGL